VPIDVVKIRSSERTGFIELDVVSKNIKTRLDSRIHGLVQPAVHCIVCTKCEEHELSARIEKVGIPCTVFRQHLGEMFAARRTRDGIPKKFNPSKKKLTLSFGGRIWV
jgi:hypothetical protein